MEIEKVFRTLSMAAAEEYLSMSSPEWVTERKARAMYGSNLRKWIESDLVKPVEQRANGRRVYEGHRLKALHVFFMTGMELYEALRLLNGNGMDSISESVLSKNCRTNKKR